jgi:hypothetical protein
MKRLVGVIMLGMSSGVALAKLPPLSDEAKAKAEEGRSKAAWTDKVGAYQLCKAQDRVAVHYLAEAKKSGKDVKPVAAAPCADPGPFAATPPAQKPLEASRAHSPPGMATSPPGSKVPAAELGKKKP